MALSYLWAPSASMAPRVHGRTAALFVEVGDDTKLVVHERICAMFYTLHCDGRQRKRAPVEQTLRAPSRH
jgi:hypothetical protein